MQPLLLALGTVIGPFLLGLGTGRELRRFVVGPPRRRLVPALAVLVALSPLAVGHLLPLSIYDLLMMSLCFAVAFYCAGSANLLTQLPPASVGVAVLILAIGLAGAELLARRIGPVERHAHPPDELHIIFENTEMD